jgi:hypothetical protein
MNKLVNNDSLLINAESPFTELFSLLIQNKTLAEGHVSLAYKTSDLEVMHQHIDNAIEVLLQGLQDLGHVVGMVGDNEKKIISDLNHIGFFISAISNLTEALNNLRSDTSYTLKQRRK